jgi:riboflavin kinase / FMN adenylyltransferase
VPPFELDGRDVRSSDIRAAIGAGDLDRAERLLGRPYAIVGDVDAAGRMTFAMPVALPPVGRYSVAGPGGRTDVEVRAAAVHADGIPPSKGLRIAFDVTAE